MDTFKEFISSGNIVAWIVIILMLIIFIKFLKSAGKGILLFGVLCLGVFLISKYFSGVAEPIADFVRGGWLGDQRPD